MFNSNFHVYVTVTDISPDASYDNFEILTDLIENLRILYKNCIFLGAFNVPSCDLQICLNLVMQKFF